MTAGIVTRLLAGAILAIALVAGCGPRIAEAFLPILQWSFVHLDTDDRLVELSIADRGALSGSDRVYHLVVAPEKMVFVGDRLVTGNPQGRATISVLIAYLWQTFVIALPLALAWPSSHCTSAHREWAIRMACLVFMISVFSVLDLPFVLWAQVWQTYLDAFAPGKFSVLLLWANFLQNGGRFALGVVAAGVSVLVARRVTR